MSGHILYRLVVVRGDFYPTLAVAREFCALIRMVGLRLLISGKHVESNGKISSESH